MGCGGTFFHWWNCCFAAQSCPGRCRQGKGDGHSLQIFQKCWDLDCLILKNVLRRELLYDPNVMVWYIKNCCCFLSSADLTLSTLCIEVIRWRLTQHEEILKKRRPIFPLASRALAAWKSVTAFSKKWGGMWETWLNVSMKRWVTTLFGRGFHVYISGGG